MCHLSHINNICNTSVKKRIKFLQELNKVQKLQMKKRIDSLNKKSHDLKIQVQNLKLKQRNMKKAIEIVLLVYRVFTYLLISPGVKFNETYVPTPIGLSGDRIRYVDPEAHRFMSCFIILLYALIIWFINCLDIAACGEAIKAGLSYVNRHGLIICETAKERLFIQSLYFHYRPMQEYFKGAWFLFNRSFILGVLAWSFAIAFGLLSLSPFLLQKQPIRSCAEARLSGDVGCVTVFISRGQLLTDRSREKVRSNLLRTQSTGIIKDPKSKTLRIELPTTTTEVPNKLIDEFPNYPCSGTTFLDSSGGLVDTQVLNRLGCDISGLVVRPYTSFNIVLCFKNFSFYYNQIPTKENSYPYAGVQHLYNCATGNEANTKDRDDCGNVAFGNPKKVPVIIYYKTQNGTPRGASICCYNYNGIQGNEESLKYCHMQSPEQAYYSCLQNPKLSNSKTICSDPPTKCEFTWNDENGKQMEVSTDDILIYELMACEALGSEILPYESAGTPSYCYKQSYQNDPRPYAKSRIDKQKQYYCFGTREEIEGVDSCGNIGFGNAKLVDVKLRLVVGTDDAVELCIKCFDYVQFGTKNKASLKHCHMQSTKQAASACTFVDGNYVASVETKSLRVTVECGLRNPVICESRKNAWPDGTTKGLRFAACFLIGSRLTLIRAYQTTLGERVDCNNKGSNEVERPYDGVVDIIYFCNVYPPVPMLINDTMRDDCGNLPFAHGLTKKFIRLKLSDSSTPGPKIEECWDVCVWNYKGIEGNDESIRRGHMLSELQAKTLCKRRNTAGDCKKDAPITC